MRWVHTSWAGYDLMGPHTEPGLRLINETQASKIKSKSKQSQILNSKEMEIHDYSSALLFCWEFTVVFLLRPLLAVVFVFSTIAFCEQLT